MSLYTPQQIQEVMKQVYEDNFSTRLKSMKIAKYLSTLSAPIIIRADMESDLYSADFKMFYSFHYTDSDLPKFNSWLKEMCKEHPIDGKSTGRKDDLHFHFDDEINGEQVSIDVFGRYEAPAW